MRYQMTKPTSIQSDIGAALVSTLLAVGLAGLVTAGTMKSLSDNMKMSALVEDKNELNNIRLRIGTKLDCGATLGITTPGGGTPPAANCTNMRPRGRHDERLVISDTPGSGNFANAYQLSEDWWVRLDCDPTAPAQQRSVRVMVAKRSGTGFARDPLSQEEINFNKPVFGGPGQLKLCNEFFRGAQDLVGMRCQPPAGSRAMYIDSLDPNADNIHCTSAGSGNIAASAVSERVLQDNSVNTGIIADGQVTSTNIAQGGVANADLAGSSIYPEAIKLNAVSGTKIAAGQIDSRTIADRTVSKSDLAVNAIQNGHIADNAVDTLELVDGAVDNAQLQDGAVTQAKLVSVQGSDFRSRELGGTAYNNKFATRTIQSDRLVENTLTRRDIAGNTLDSGHLSSRAITAESMWWLTEGRDFMDGLAKAVRHEDIGQRTITPDKLGIVCQHGEILRWSNSSGTWICGGRPRVMVSVAAIHAHGGSLGNKYYDPQAEVLVPPPNGESIWTVGTRNFQIDHTTSIPMDYVRCDPNQGWRLISCSTYSTDIFNPVTLQNHRNNPMSGTGAADSVTWFDRDASPITGIDPSTGSRFNLCNNNDIDQAYSISDPGFILNFPNWFYRMYAVCMKVQ